MTWYNEEMPQELKDRLAPHRANIQRKLQALAEAQRELKQANADLLLEIEDYATTWQLAVYDNHEYKSVSRGTKEDCITGLNVLFGNDYSIQGWTVWHDGVLWGILAPIISDKLDCIQMVKYRRHLVNG